MSVGNASNEIEPLSVTWAGDAAFRDLARLALRAGGYTVEPDGESMWLVTVPPAEQPLWRKPTPKPSSENGPANRNDAAPRVLDAALLAALVERAAGRSTALHAAPVDQPGGVHQLTEKLFAPYQVDGGRVHLSGCSLEARPFLRLSYAGGSERQPRLEHRYFDREGLPLEADWLTRLALDQELEPYDAAESAAMSRAEVQQWIDLARAHANGVTPAASGGYPLATVVWCRYAQGKLAFEIGEASVSLTFEGWARDLAAGRVEMPPYACPLSGRRSYHLAADDQGRITVSEAIATCEVSGRRVVETDLEICQQTGRRALKEYLATCEQTHRRVLKSALEPCDMCRRQLASVSLVKGRCEACRHLTPVRKDDPTLARLLHQYPKLDRWSKWRIGETPHLFIFTAASWLQRMLVVVDKQSLEVGRMATRNRFGNYWSDAPPKLLEELTG